MSDPRLFETLQPLHFFRDIPEEYLRKVASIARLEDYPENTVLFREGSVLHRIFIVAEGSVGLEIQKAGQEPWRILTIGEGELLGWSPLLTQRSTTATGRTITATKVVSINATQVLEMCQQDTRFGFLFMRRTAEALAARLSAARVQLLDAFQDDVPVICDEPGAGD